MTVRIKHGFGLYWSYSATAKLFLELTLSVDTSFSSRPSRNHKAQGSFGFSAESKAHSDSACKSPPRRSAQRSAAPSYLPSPEPLDEGVGKGWGWRCAGVVRWIRARVTRRSRESRKGREAACYYAEHKEMAQEAARDSEAAWRLRATTTCSGKDTDSVSIRD